MVSPFEIEEIFPDVATGSRLPRRQEGNSAQGLAATLVADYTLPTRAWLPSAAIVTLLVESGLSSGGARTAISRLARRGVLESSRDGRYSSYRLTEDAANELSAGGAWIARFGERERVWDGHWTLVAFSLPEELSAQRRSLRAQLRWLGFAPLYDGLWVSPDAWNPTVEQRLSAAAFGAMTVMRAAQVDFAGGTARSPVDAWDIPSIARHYEEFDRRWQPVLSQVGSEDVDGPAAVRIRTQIMDGYRHIPLLDPQLPTELLPQGWPRARIRDLFVAIYDGLAEQAEHHVSAIARRAAPGADAVGIRAHTVSGMASA
ncbi:phenylacetic acid degradation operon negative regulatory protein [Allocatelliglobosispora scoriae]|uniref:Phenylacetic acid degradation operon negative regulatory protein n=1 Tax=Allocatelliglobosispora scoriae TaxID=643052 RepID=A0A841BIN3_9ACTN|nr:PaaX family transcriptional regulator C-terminal domain-containing protein [Allocatelliglobosispora scoriae]MBB5866761.1 phenylacetic acid degradation operon negative regulatory protein [Allocatelliglobosispora scoriae]